VSVPFEGSKLATTDGASLYVVGGAAKLGISELLFLGWRPWRSLLGEIVSVTYATRRHRRYRQSRYGAPVFTHSFGAPYPELRWSPIGGLSVAGGSYSVYRDVAGQFGMITG
jgi:hypothetical protein